MTTLIDAGRILRSGLSDLLQDKRAVTAVEYTVIAALIIGAVATAFTTLGTDISTKLGVVAALV